MSKKFFTADFHLGMAAILKYEDRPFLDIQSMDAAFLDECLQKTQPGDIIYHIGDLYSFGIDRGVEGLKSKPSSFVSKIQATFVNIRGNHDVNNKVKSIGESIRLSLSTRYPNVSLSHYPSYDHRVGRNCLNNEIHLCGHVHKKWKHCLDLSSNVMNINMGVDVWQYHIVSEDELIAYLNSLFRTQPDRLLRCKTQIDGKVVFLKPNQ